MMYMPNARNRGTFQREVYQGPRLGIAGVEMFGWTSTPTAGQLGLAGHTHPRAYEICLIAAGHVTWWVGRRIFSLGPGSIYITRPGEEHGGSEDVLQPCAIYWLQVRLQASRTLPGLTRAASAQLARGYRTMRHRSFPASPELIDTFHRLHAELRERRDQWRIAAHAALHTLLVRVLRDHDAAASDDLAFGEPSPPIAHAMARIEQQLDENTRIKALADSVGLGVSRFHERFVDEVGFSPADYRMHLRIRRARAALRQSDHSITRIAHELGFSSSQHFATAFRRMVGLSPTAFRQRQSSDSSSSSSSS